MNHESLESPESREWSLGHAEQHLFSCVSSKVIVCDAVIWHKWYVICQMFMLILGTCLATFVFMSRLKTECLWQSTRTSNYGFSKVFAKTTPTLQNLWTSNLFYFLTTIVRKRQLKFEEFLMIISISFYFFKKIATWK